MEFSPSVAYDDLLELLSYLSTLRKDAKVNESIYFKFMNHGGLFTRGVSSSVFEILRNTERIQAYRKDA